ncbi:cell wall synthase accessory phosphoprotein MacP [Enterococcus nangangensis]
MPKPLITRSELRKRRTAEEEQELAQRQAAGKWRSFQEKPQLEDQQVTPPQVEKTMQLSQKDIAKIQRQLAKTDQREDRQLEKKLVKARKKQKELKTSRRFENEKSRERNHALNVAIIVVAILLAVMVYLVLNW